MATSVPRERRGNASWEKGINWGDVLTETQKQEMIAVCVELLEELLNKDAIKTLINPLYIVSGQSPTLVVTKDRSLILQTYDNLSSQWKTGNNIPRDSWPEIIVKFHLSPDNIAAVIDKVTRKLGSIKANDQTHS